MYSILRQRVYEQMKHFGENVLLGVENILRTSLFSITSEKCLYRDLTMFIPPDTIIKIKKWRPL